MRRVLMAGGLCVFALLATSVGAPAETYDPLHFTCSNCGGDNGVFTPINGVTPTGISVNETGTKDSIAGDFILKVLVPNNVLLSTLNVAGTLNANPFSGSLNLFTSATQGTQWTSGSLETDFMGFNLAQGGSPPNPIGAFLPSTQNADPGATGFFVLTLDLGNLTVPEQNKGISPFFLDLANSTAGLWLLGDVLFTQNGQLVDLTTAQSGALFASTVSEVPLPGAIWLFGAGLAGIVTLARRKSKRQLPSSTS